MSVNVKNFWQAFILFTTLLLLVPAVHSVAPTLTSVDLQYAEVTVAGTFNKVEAGGITDPDTADLYLYCCNDTTNTCSPIFSNNKCTYNGKTGNPFNEHSSFGSFYTTFNWWETADGSYATWGNRLGVSSVWTCRISTTGMANGTQYIRCRSYDSTDFSAPIISANFTMNIPAGAGDVNLQVDYNSNYATGSRKGGMTLSWDDLASETAYKIWRSDDGFSSDFNLAAVLDANSTSYSDNDLNDNTTYWYILGATVSGVDSNSSADSNVTVDRSPPTIPANLAKTGTLNSTTLTWSESDDNMSFLPNSTAYWRFNEGSGASALDATGNANTGDINGATYVDGRSNYGLYFDGTNDYVDINDDSTLDLNTNFTIATWFKLDNSFNNSSTGSMGIFDKPNAFGMKLDASTGRLAFSPPWKVIRDENKVSIYSLISYDGNLFASTDSTSQDANIITYDGANWSTSYSAKDYGSENHHFVVHDSNLYVSFDKNMYTYNGANWSQSYAAGNTIHSLASHDGNLYVGTGGGNIYTYNGTNWSLFYNRGSLPIDALTSYNGNLYAKIDSNTYLYSGGSWSVDLNEAMFAAEIYDGNLYAVTSDGNVYTTNGTNWSLNYVPAENIIPQSFAVHDNKLYLSTDPIGKILVYDGSGWSEDGDVYGSSVYSLASYDGKLYTGSSTSWLCGEQNCYNIHISIRDTNLATTTSSWDTGWHHVAVTYDDSSMKFYVDGNLEKSVSYSVDYNNSGNNLFIGRKYSTGINWRDDELCYPNLCIVDTSQYFKGTIDEVLFAERALSASEISDTYWHTVLNYWIHDDNTSTTYGSYTGTSTALTGANIGGHCFRVRASDYYDNFSAWSASTCGSPSPVCGNQVCESTENSSNCCLDCEGCGGGYDENISANNIYSYSSFLRTEPLWIGFWGAKDSSSDVYLYSVTAMPLPALETASDGSFDAENNFLTNKITAPVAITGQVKTMAINRNGEDINSVTFTVIERSRENAFRQADEASVEWWLNPNYLKRMHYKRIASLEYLFWQISSSGGG